MFMYKYNNTHFIIYFQGQPG